MPNRLLMAGMSGIFFKKSREICVCQKKVVPSDAALALPIPPKVRSHDAAHTIASLGYVLFSARPFPWGVGPSEKGSF